MDSFDWMKFGLFILGCLNFLGMILVGSFHWFSHNKIVGNDLHHLSLYMQDIQATQKTHGEILTEVEKKIVDITARCEERHAKISYTRKKKIR